MLSNLSFIATISVFGTFFWYIGYPVLAGVCGCIILIFTFLTINPQQRRNTLSNQGININGLLQKHSLFLARCVMLAGLGQFVHFFGVGYIEIILGSIAINIIIRAGSYLHNYKDGQTIFQLSFSLACFILIGYVWHIATIYEFVEIIHAILYLHLGTYAFIVFIIGPHSTIDKTTQSITYILTHFVILTTLFRFIPYVGNLALVGAQIYLSILYFLYFYVYSHNIDTDDFQPKKITAKDILAGAKVLDKTRYMSIEQPNNLLIWGKAIVHNVFNRIHDIIFGSNIFVILGVIGIYILQLQEGNPSLLQQTMYRASLGLFFINYVTIKRITHRTRILHRIFAFIIINFAVYVNLIYVIGTDNRNTITIIAILRNFGNTIAISQSKYIFYKGLFIAKDYWFWIITNIISMCINVGLLIHTNLPGELLFAFVFLYIGIFGFMTYYNMKYIAKLPAL